MICISLDCEYVKCLDLIFDFYLLGICFANALKKNNKFAKSYLQI